jgi:shikimate kinase
MPCFNNNISLINQNGISVYLKCSPLTILQRLQTSKTSRPILKSKSTDELFDYVHKNIAEREEYYNQANLIIKGESPNLKELISQIQNL